MQLAIIDADNNEDEQLSRKETSRYLRSRRKSINQGVKSIFREFDEDDDERLSSQEIEDTRIATLIAADSNGDEVLSYDEVIDEFRFGTLTSDKAWIEDEADVWFESDANQDGKLTVDEVEEADHLTIEEADLNKDGSVDRSELKLDLQANFCEADFTIKGNVAEMIGTIGPMTPAHVMELIVNSPQVNTVILKRVPGSIDDVANELSMRLFRTHGFKTIVPKDGLVASGGTDLFLSGETRFAHAKAKLGVHAWSDLDGSGADRKRKSKDHQPYLDLFKELNIPEAFYWYTLKIAGPDSMHWMTEDERNRFQFNTSAPVYQDP